MRSVIFSAVFWIVVEAAALASVLAVWDVHPQNPPDPTTICTVAGSRFSLFVQLALLLLVVCVLVGKRHVEYPRRSVRVWLMDTSKQGAASGAAHLCGMLNTIILGRLTHVEYECGWYLVTYLVDTTFGVYCSITFLQLLEEQAAKRHWSDLEHTGVYPTWVVWVKQLLSFTGIVIVSRALCTIVLCALLFPLRGAVTALCAVFAGHPRIFLVSVMLVGPGLLNSIQAWVQDNYLKRKTDDYELLEDDDSC
eukprot:TRINITY_DN53094_c0_g1_i1.p1 TRINITY_DN53094_c0_g1~~TRINITY_DN53094_c0_g1_i1.p1  ORF type:complete len:251 (+),score=55.05 TRINITY_DN53094_c0_g1_i1:62-814(+)